MSRPEASLDLRLRATTVADLEPLVSLEQQVFGADAWSAASVAEELSGADRRGVVAQVLAHGDTLLGYAVARLVGEVADLQRIAVAPEVRRRGVASALLARVADAARDGSARRMLLEVSADNGPGLAFYRRHGFAVVDRRPRYYRDGSDAVVMGAELADLGDGRRP